MISSLNKRTLFDILSPIVQVPDCSLTSDKTDVKNLDGQFDPSVTPTMNDISVWFGGISLTRIRH